MPAVTVQDLNNAKIDVDHIAAIATSTATTSTDRLGHEKLTMFGAVQTLTAFNPRGARTNTTYNLKDIYTEGGIAYVAVVQSFVSTSLAADLATGNVAVYQGLTPADLDASIVPYRAPSFPAVERGVDEKLSEVASILDAGGVGDYDPVADTGTNCISPLSFLSARGPARQVVHFPAMPGQTNNYLLSFPSGYTVGNSDVVVSADPGVTLYSNGVVFACEFVTATRVVDLALSTIGQTPVTYIFQPNADRPAPDENRKSRWLNSSDAVAPVLAMIDPRTGWRAILTVFPGTTGDGGDTAGATSSPKISFSENSVVVTTAAGDGALHGGFMRPLAGDEVGATLDFVPGSSGYTPSVMVRTARGTYGSLLYTQSVTNFQKTAGADIVQASGNSLGMADHESYSPYSAIVTVRILSAYDFQVLVNGAVVQETRTPDPIQELGFGAYLTAECTVSWTNIFLSRGHSIAGARGVSLFTIGDSITADQRGAWPRRCREALDGTKGVRVVAYTNQAVPGDDSNAQLALLQTNGVPAGTTHSVIQIGTNDIQGSGSVSTLSSNVSQMIDILQAAGSKIVIGLPPLWYTRAQAGTRGQNSLRYEQGTAYRIALLKLCANRGVPLLDSLPEYGPIVANFVKAGSSPNLIGLDPMVYDNLHPGSFMARIMGANYAGMLLGQMLKMGTNETPWADTPAAWPVQNSWALDPTDRAQFRIAPDGARRIRANYSTGVGAVLTNGTTVQQFGALMWPKRSVPFEAWTSNGTRVLMVMGIDGQLRVYGAAGIGSTQVFVDSGFYDVT